MKPAPDKPRDVLADLAARLPQLSAARAAAHAASAAIDDAPSDVRRVNPGEKKRAAERHLEKCQKAEAAAHFARDHLALRAVIRAAAPAIEARIAARKGAVDRAQARQADTAAAVSFQRARCDTLRAQRDAPGARQGEVEAAQARLAAASDAGDDAGAEAAAGDIARVRREIAELVEPLELRLKAAHDAAARAEAQHAEAEAQVATAVKALSDAELDRLKLSRDEAAANLLERDIELSAAGHFYRPSSTNYSIGETPEVLGHLRGQRLDVTASLIDNRGKERRIALEADRRDAT